MYTVGEKCGRGVAKLEKRAVLEDENTVESGLQGIQE